MSEAKAIGIFVVRLRMRGSDLKGAVTSKRWAAAVPRSEAVEAVKQAVANNDWTFELTDEQLTIKVVQSLRMKPGSVKELADL